MEKVRLAIVGRNNSNLKDLGHLDGDDYKYIFNIFNIPHRVLALVSA